MKHALLFLHLLVTLSSIPSVAHEMRPGYLELRQTATEAYDVFWKVPGLGENLRLGLYIRLPATCRNVTEPRASMANNAFIERWTIRCEGGLAQGRIGIEGLSATMTDVLVRLERLDGTVQVTRLTPAAASFVVEATPGTMQIARTYLALGVEHIVGGFDHLMFVLALMILVQGVRRLVATITTFTLAHSITLAGATLGYVHVPGPPVEAAIALSIVFVAVEILHGQEGRSGLAQRFPWLIAFVFGLLHGFGFASALSEVGLPQTAIPAALLFFNVGVEIGQLLFIGCVVASVTLARRLLLRSGLQTPPWARRVLPYVIGSFAMFWVIQRVTAF